MQLPCQTGRVDGSITCALVVALTHPYGAKCGSERINAVRFGAVSEVSHEFPRFDQLGRSGPASRRCGARIRTQLRPRFGGQLQGRAAGPTQQARSGQPPGIRCSSGSSGADAGHADRARGAVEGARNETYAAVTGSPALAPDIDTNHVSEAVKLRALDRVIC